ncbi:MAG: hypothetical protein KDI51_18350, partial [Xanthomonadales bacterium]|nr:hypothetical protein [Xanthomonadales bacterium]
MSPFNLLIGRIGCCCLLLGLAPLAQADTPRTVEQTLAWQGQAIQLHLNFPEQVRIEVGDSPELTLRAEVLLRNDAQDLSEDFRWQVQSSEGKIRIEADFGPRIGRTVIVSSGADVSGGIGEGASLTGTKMHIRIPRGAKLEVDSQSGEMHLDHPGNTLLVENNGAVQLTLDRGVDLSYSSMLGQLQVDEGLPLDAPGTDGAAAGEHPRRGRLQVHGGGAETSVTTLVGDIHLRWSPPP